jgi:hypothetical protein
MTAHHAKRRAERIAEEDRTGLKRCTKCQQSLPLSEFFRTNTEIRGRVARCRSCQVASRKAWNDKNRAAFLRGELQALTEARCSCCKETLPASHFSKNHGEKGGLQNVCLLCARMRKYGLTKQEYFTLLESQGNQCAICRDEFNAEAKWRGSPAVDHDHETGAVRGLLCLHCNTALGMVNDNQDVLRGMLRYLENHEAKSLAEETA